MLHLDLNPPLYFYAVVATIKLVGVNALARLAAQAVSVFDLGASGQVVERSSSAASALPALAGAGPLRLA